jgi:hypothetical protein
VPATISNGEFWRLHLEFSEPGGSFSSDNFTSNEMSIGQLSTELRLRGRTGGAYVGVGPEQNFTYIAALRPDIVFIVDIRRQAIMQHLMYKAIFEMSANRSEFISMLFSKPLQAEGARDTSIVALWGRYLPLPQDTALYARNLDAIFNHLTNVRSFGLSTSDSNSIRYVYNAFYLLGPGISYGGLGRGGAAGAAARMNAPPVLTGSNFATLTSVTDAARVPRSFLATEADFQYVKGMHERNLIVTVVGDFGGPQALRKVGDWLRQHGTTVNAFYTSNVEQYLFSPLPKWRDFYTSVGFMPLDSASLFIRPSGSAGGTPLAALASIVAVRGAAAAALYGNAATPPGTPPTPPSPPQPPAAPPPPPNVQPIQDPARGLITGVVTDAIAGIGLDAAAVQIVGTTLGANAAADGRFTIYNVPPGVFRVVARRIGYSVAQLDSVRVSAGQITTVNLSASAQVINLSAVVSTGGGASATPPVIQIRNPIQRVQLCPMVPFLEAFKAGRVNAYSDAQFCAR